MDQRYDHLDLDMDCDGGAGGGVAQKAAIFGGMFKRSSKSSEPSLQFQDNLPANSELSKSNDSLSENNNTKEKGGMFKGILKKSAKPAKEGTSTQATLSVQNTELSVSSDSLPDNNKSSKERTGVLGGILRRSPKPGHERRTSQHDLLVDSELAASSDSLSENNAKETGGIFSGMFKKSPKPSARSQSQEDLSAPSELSGSIDNLSENSSTKEKGGIFSGVFRKPKPSSAKSQEDLSAVRELSASTDSLSEKTSKNALSGISKSTFFTDKQEKTSNSGSEETLDNKDNKQTRFAGAMTKLNPFRSANQYERQTQSDDVDPPVSSEKPAAHKQNVLVGAMNKLNPFRTANKKDPEETTEVLKESDKHGDGKARPVKSNMIQREGKETSETPPVPCRPTDEELKGTAAQHQLKHRGTDALQENKKMIPRERKVQVPPARPTEEFQTQSDDDGLNHSEDVNATESKTTQVKKPKRHNPFMPRAAAKAASDDEGLKEDESPSQEEDGDRGRAEQTKVKKPKKHNPFMPRLKTKAAQNPVQDGAAAENEGGNKSLFDQLEEFRIDPAEPEEDRDFEGLMAWWNSVEPWEDTPKDEDMTEKEEAKAFAVTADKVQKGIRVFNKLFTERAESLWQHVIDLNSIADGLDKFNKNTKIAQITGGSTSAIGGVATIAGLALAPFTMGTSLIVTAVGLGVATAGGLTSAGAGISNQVNNSMDRKKVEKIVEDYQEKIADLNKCMQFIKQGIENLRKFDLMKMKKHAYNRDFPALNNIYEDGAMVGKAILINANEIMRVVQIANVAGSTAARAVQIASMATGVLTGLFVGMDIYFVAKDSKELKKGAKSEFAAKIREVAIQLHEGLVELNGIREELQSTTSSENTQSNTATSEDKKDKEENTQSNTATSDTDKKEKDEKHDSSDEDEIARIKKAIKKDYENREYV